MNNIQTLIAASMIFMVQGMFAMNVSAAESLVMNLTMNNDSSDAKSAAVVHYLPSELAKEDVLDAAGLQLRYDDKRSALYLIGEAELAPNESKNYKVIVRDVWKIAKADIEFLRAQTKDRVKFLEGTEDHAAGQMLAERIHKDLAAIEASQAEEMDIPSRIEAHRVASDKMRQIAAQTTVMTDFVKQARWYKEITGDVETVKMLIQVKNPMSDELADQEVIRYLPRGVVPDDLVDAQGFSVKYDPERQLYYLFKTMTLKGEETVSATVTFKNSWKIPIRRLDELSVMAAGYVERLKGSQYEETAVKLNAELERLAAQIKELQAKYDSPADMIANFSLNLTRFNAVEDGVSKLKELVEEIEHPVPQTLPYYIKPATPDVSTTWKIIYGFIGFLTVLGLMFYALWWGQSKARLNRTYESHKA